MRCRQVVISSQIEASKRRVVLLARRGGLRVPEPFFEPNPVGIVALTRPAPLLGRGRRTRDVARERIERGDRGVLDPARASQQIVRVVLEALPSDLEPGALGDVDAETMTLRFGQWRGQLSSKALPIRIAKQPRVCGRIGFFRLALGLF